MAGLLIGAFASNSGKTLFTCGLLQALLNRNLSTTAFKCGPDYIDPLFHKEVLGIESYNLDTFLCGKSGVKKIFDLHSKASDIAIIEGVMGYYDGLAGISTEASAYDVAVTTGTPVVLLVNGKGASVSITPQIKGFLEYKKESMIRGVVFNQISPMMYPRLKKMVEEELKIPVFGYLPSMKNVNFESRYLGLKLPTEVAEIKKKLQILGEQVENTVDVDGLLRLSRTSLHLENEAEGSNVSKYASKEPMNDSLHQSESNLGEEVMVHETQAHSHPRIGIAKDEAFCFIYQDNLDVLSELGATLIPFSPLHDTHLPERLDGIILYGGYPELYAKQLSENASFRKDLKNALEKGLPCMAECGGFMYLQEFLEDKDGVSYPMVGYLNGKSYPTGSLRRFGYSVLSEGQVFGEDVGEIKTHEFHYFDSEECGESFHAKKPLSTREWNCMVSTKTLLAGYPHIAYRGNVEVARSFLRAATRNRVLSE